MSRIVVSRGSRSTASSRTWAVDLRLVDSRTVGEGVAILTYEPVRA